MALSDYPETRVQYSDNMAITGDLARASDVSTGHHGADRPRALYCTRAGRPAAVCLRNLTFTRAKLVHGAGSVREGRQSRPPLVKSPLVICVFAGIGKAYISQIEVFTKACYVHEPDNAVTTLLTPITFRRFEVDNRMDQVQSFFGLVSSVWSSTPLVQLLTATFAILVLLVILYWGAVEQNDGLRRPPGPRPWPIIGNLALMGPLPYLVFQNLAKQYGPIFRLRLGSKEAIVVSSPKIAEEVLKTHDLAFASRPKSTQVTIMDYNMQTLSAAPYGQYWRDTKKLFTLELLTNRRVQQFQSVRREEVLGTLNAIIEECRSGEAVCLGPKLKELSMNNITRMMMNKTFFGPNATLDPREATKQVENFEELLKLNAVFVIGDYIPFFHPFDLQGCKKPMRVVAQKNDKFFQGIIDERRQKHQSSEQHIQKDVMMDFLDVLLTRPTGNGEKPLTDTEIKGILQTGVIAGTDTSGVTVLFAMAELLRHPAVLRKARDEIDTVVGRERLVEEDDIPNLKYLRCVLMEVMRLHPVGPLLLPHECRESREVAGYHIPLKCLVLINTYAIGRDPEVWERPLEFYPERFLSTSIDLHGQDFQLLPFGSGRRMCPGKNLGLLLVEQMLAMFIHTCDWALPRGMSPQDVDLAEGPGLLLVLKNPLNAIATPRLSMGIISGT